MLTVEPYKYSELINVNSEEFPPDKVLHTNGEPGIPMCVVELKEINASISKHDM